MRAEPRPTEVRRIVVGIFAELGATPASLFEMEERVRIERGRCLARTYRAEGLMAMWLVEVGIVQFYDEEGHMLATVNLLKEFVPRAMAA